MEFKNKKIAVLGFGAEGISSVRFLLSKGADVAVLDQKPEIQKEIEALKLNIKLKTGKDYLSELDSFDLIVRSPGINLSKIQNIDSSKITSQTKIFFDFCPSQIIGVTGTKGKGTTSSLIYEMLKKQGKDAYLGGNIGNPPLEFLEKLTKDSIVVLELSSFQLIDLDKSPHIAVVLMITSEHLNYHQNVEEYVDAKRNILRHQTSEDFAIINRDYPASNESDIHTEGKVYFVSREREVGLGCFVEPPGSKEGKIILRMSAEEEEIIDAKEILLPGVHNLENVCAAVMVAKIAGVSSENIKEVLKTFKGLEHRLELVARVNEVSYYDDSFSTTPETAIAAITAFKNPEILILGGSGKGSDFTELGEIIKKAKNIKAIIGIGEEWNRMKAKFPISDFQFPIFEGAKNIFQIVQAAAKIAKSGDVVLLSPACASFDMFRNYKDRGDQFKKEVLDLRHQTPN